MKDILSRRGFLGGVTVASIGGLLRPRLDAAFGDFQPVQTSVQPFRFVHLTDIHLEPERNAVAGFTKCLAAVEALRPRPDFILTGGDLVFDTLEVDRQRGTMLWELFKKVVADNTSLPIHHTVGNHDVFGWGRRHGVTPKTPGFGKKLMQDQLEMKQTYYHFDHKGWRFFVLDNIQPVWMSHGYQGFVDPAQREWLAAELKRTPGPSVICEHIPSLTVTLFGDARVVSGSSWKIGSGSICTDAPDRLGLIRKHNVKLWLSGHIHALDRCEFHGTTFICDGAVCGAWWTGPRDGMNEGFGVIDLQPDGSIVHHYHEYGWKAAPEPQTQPADQKHAPVAK